MMRHLTLLLAIFLSGGIKAQLIIDRCDITNSWTSGNSLSIDADDAKEGRASISMTGSQSDWFSKIFAQAYTGTTGNDFVSLSLYVSDVSALEGSGYIEVNSSAEAGTDAYQWPVSTLGLTSGWNNLKIQLSAATKMGTPDLDAIRQFKVYQPLASSITAKIDIIRFEKSIGNTDPDKLLNVQEVNTNSLDGKVMFGYQGWFSAIGDGGPVGDRFHHWGDLSTGSGLPGHLSVEMWFDDRDFDPDELYKTGYFYPDGREARAFSSYNRKTVMRHMKWLRDYDLDGVFLQRFMTEARDPNFKEFRDSVAAHVRDGSERYGRTFAMMWDGVAYSGAAEDIIEDWKHLVDDLKITESPNYLHHQGRPLISLWGYTVREAATLEELLTLIDFFHNSPEEKYRASIKLGCNNNWRTRDNGKWVEAFKQVEVISPWAVGRYGSSKSSFENFADDNTVPDLEWCNENNIDYIPVNWPGFSWFNLHDGPKNQHPRRNGDFFWEQASGNLSRGANSLYIAMFDEVDEATAFFKLPEDESQSPDKGYWLNLDADGGDLPSDWYLRAVGLVTDVMRGEEDNRLTLGEPADGLDVFAVRANHATCGESNGQLILNYPSGEGQYEFSIDGGNTYNYQSSDTESQVVVEGLPAELYDVWVRYADGTYPTDLGDRLIVDAEVAMDINSQNASCLDDGQISIQLGTNPYVGSVDISLDGGQTYDLTLEEGVYNVAINNLEPGTYDIWGRWTGTTCGNAIKRVEIERYLEEPEIGIEVFDERFSGDICEGSRVALSATVVDAEVSSWNWTGPNGFTAQGDSIELAESIEQSQSGEYTATYTDAKNCTASTVVNIEVSSSSVPEIDWIVEVTGEPLDPDSAQICEGSRVILEGLPNNDDYTYEWSGPSNFSKTGRRATLAAVASGEINGNYHLKVIHGNCFNKLSKELIVSADACEEDVVLEVNNSDQFLIYPNPNYGDLNLRIKSGEFRNVRLIDMAGREYEVSYTEKNSDRIVIALGDVSRGIYQLVIELMDGKQISKRIQKM